MKKLFLNLSVVLIGLAGTLPARERIECGVEPYDRITIEKDDEVPFKSSKTRSGTSTNWSGYVAATSFPHPDIHSVSKVSGEWVVPLLDSTPESAYCALWVGIDGYASGSVEQIGTSHDWVDGAQQNYAWFEMYPEPAYEITGFPLEVGDRIKGTVKYVGNNTFVLRIENITQGVFTEVPTSYTMSSTAKRSSAEWILEAPYLDGVLPLSNFGNVAFSQCMTTIYNEKGFIKNPFWSNSSLTMEDAGVTKALTSPLHLRGDFSVAWEHE